jgi:hypothetical protein
VFELLDTVGGSFSERFNGSVRAIADVANNLMSRRGSLSKEAITHSLHLSTYQESSRHSSQSTTPRSINLEKVFFQRLFSLESRL